MSYLTLDVGDLKKDVEIQFTSEKVFIRYSLWEISLKADLVSKDSILSDFLNRKIQPCIAAAYPSLNPLIYLLDVQGCFVPKKKSFYQLREVKDIFDSFKSQWYSIYYSHPLWNIVRNGQATKASLLAWITHNYHISRSAGIVAARMSIMTRSSELSDFFKQDSLDEFWHCDSYYSVNISKAFGISREIFLNERPLVSSLAFEEHTLQIAESDSLSHLLIAYFQESSITFEDDSYEFYKQVEEKYQMENFFDSWKKHIQIDVDNEHASGLANLLKSNEKISIDRFQLALTNAWLAFYYLYSALTEIQEKFHVMQTFNKTEENSSLLSKYSLSNMTQTDANYLTQGINKSAFRALSFARDHNSIMKCGLIAKKTSRIFPTELETFPENPWCVALINYLLEKATNPNHWLETIKYLSSKIAEFSFINNILDNDVRLEKEISFDEILERCMSSKDKITKTFIEN